MKGRRAGNRWALGLLGLCLLWWALGAPLTGAEWSGLPGQLRRSWRQLPLRMEQVLRQWVRGRALAAEQEPLTLRVWDVEAHALRLLPLENYVSGVVAAEMPASWPVEALKCQAVAARTRAVERCVVYGGAGCTSHPGADVCTDSTCCQAWRSPEASRAFWGDSWQALERRVTQAVDFTAGQVLTYQGRPIQVLYHAASGGRTEDAAEVFAARLPYLQSVDSPGEESFEGFATEQRFPLEEAARLLLQAFPDCGVEPSSLPAQLELISLTETGRVREMRVGSAVLSGRQVREALGLRSTWFSWETQDGQLIFRVRGYGHGVGMSQAGARAMAAMGAACPEILTHYYPGAVLTPLP